jgi:hypothetical protein
MVVIRDSRLQRDIIMLIITDCSIPLDNRNSHEGKIKVSGRHANIDYLESRLTSYLKGTRRAAVIYCPKAYTSGRINLIKSQKFKMIRLGKSYIIRST